VEENLNMDAQIEKDIEEIKEIINTVKKEFVQFGGEVNFFDVLDNKVRIETLGYCHR
jgi:hypothetical protein